MGNRAEVHFVDEQGHFSPGVYLHYDGSEVPRLLDEAMPFFKKGDSEYCAARFCGVVHSFLIGKSSYHSGLGLRPPINNSLRETSERAHNLDWGLAIVHVDDFQVELHGRISRRPQGPLPEILLDASKAYDEGAANKIRRRKRKEKAHEA